VLNPINDRDNNPLSKNKNKNNNPRIYIPWECNFKYEEPERWVRGCSVRWIRQSSMVRY